MVHGALAQAAAVVGALGAVLVVTAARRPVLVCGFGVLACAESMLAVALVPTSDLRKLEGPVHAGALALGIIVVAALAVGLVRRPAAAPIVLLLAAPFRIPVTLGHQHAFLLLPLYVALAAAALALLWRVRRGEAVRRPPLALAVPVAAFMALDSVSLLWARDLQQGSIELVFFILPFAALVAVVARTRFEAWTVRALAIVFIGLTCMFALIGLYERVTHTLLYAPTLLVDNAYTSFFRVTSVFRDPSLYGRHLALGIAVVIVLHLVGKLRIEYAAPLVALLWAGLWFSYSQSSMVTIFVVTMTAALVLGDRRTRQVVAAVGLAGVLAGGLVIGLHIRHSSARSVTSGRSRLVAITWPVFRNHPLAGVGVGSQPLASRHEAARHTAAKKNRSHTTPLTVAAELGVLGLLAYVGLLAGAARLLAATAARDRALGLALAAVFLSLVVHSFFYSGFFEDPLTWGSLAVAGAAVLAPRRASVPAGRTRAAPTPPLVPTGRPTP